MEIKRVEAGLVPANMLLVYGYDEPVFEFDPHPFNPGGSNYVSYESSRHTVVYEAGQLAPVECFEKGILLEHGDTAEYEDDQWGGYFTIRNEWGRAVADDDTGHHES